MTTVDTTVVPDTTDVVTTASEIQTESESEAESDSESQASDDTFSSVLNNLSRKGKVKYDTVRYYERVDSDDLKCEVRKTYETDELDYKGNEDFMNVLDNGTVYMLDWDGTIYSNISTRFILLVTEDGKNWEPVEDPDFLPALDEEYEVIHLLRGEYYDYQFYKSTGVKNYKTSFRLNGGKMLILGNSTEKDHTYCTDGFWTAVIPDKDCNINIYSHIESIGLRNEEEWYDGFTTSDGTVLKGEDNYNIDLTKTDRTDSDGNEIFEMNIYNKFDRNNEVLYSELITLDPDTLKPVVYSENKDKSDSSKPDESKTEKSDESEENDPELLLAE